MTTTASLDNEVSGCVRCPLSLACGPVPPSFVPAADLMVVGDFPSKEDDLYGRPFVSREGALLDKLLAAAGFDPARVHKTHAVKCRPAKTAAKKSVAACSKWLEEEVALTRPRSIVCMGRTAHASLLTLPLSWSLPVGGDARPFYSSVPVYFWKSVGSVLSAGRRADEEAVAFLRGIRIDQAA